METKLPGLDAARGVLGLSWEEIAQAVRVDYSTLYGARVGRTRSAGILDRLEQLGALASELSRVLSHDMINRWMETPAATFSGRTPREMVLAGRAETVRGALLAYNHLFAMLANAEEEKPFFWVAPGAGRLPVATIAALAMLDADVDAMVARMQSHDSQKARHQALQTRPKVRVSPDAENNCP